MGEREGTITETGVKGVARSGRSPFLYRVLRTDRPLAPSWRRRLGSVDIVELGRTEAEQTLTSVNGSTRQLKVGLVDPRASTLHARLERVLGEWVVADCGSKNGTRVNGEPVTRRTLEDGDWIEVGRTFFLFRESQADDGTEHAEASPSTVTLQPELAHRWSELVSIAASALPVMILGETGTGKEVAARTVHDTSGRRGPFVAVNSTALNQNLIDAELFGHERGVFTGADRDRPGLIRSADGGTFFLDELGDLPQDLQPKLLRVLQQREVTPVGSTKPVAVDLRVVVATHRNLDELVREGRFRADLLARVSAFRFELPALRDRMEDFGIILRTLLSRIAGAAAERIELTTDAARLLLNHDYPSNVRQLENVLGTAVVFAKGTAIEPAHLAQLGPASTTAAAPTDDDLRSTLETLVRAHQGNVSAIAREMKKGRTQILRWLKRFKIDVDAARPT